MTEPILALVVDDSDDQVQLLRRYLERSGCEVVTASTGERAIEVLREAHPDLAVVDLVLPGITGADLAARIRTTHPECLLVITSVHDTARYPEADAVLPKPFTGAQVAAVVERARSA